MPDVNSPDLSQEAMRKESFAVGREMAQNPSFDPSVGRQPHSLILEEVIAGREAAMRERSVVQDMKPAAQLSDTEIVKEARGLHAHFQRLVERFEQAPPPQRAEIREEMAPLVNRERELRQEFTGRLNPELTQDVPEQQISFSR